MQNLIDLTTSEAPVVLAAVVQDPAQPGPANRGPEPSKRERLTELVGALSGAAPQAARSALAEVATAHAPAAPYDQDEALYVVAQAMVRLRAS